MHTTRPLRVPCRPSAARRRGGGFLLVALALLFAPPAARGGILFISEGRGVPVGHAPKDFTILQSGGEFHAYYTLTNLALRANGNTGYHLNERRFGHAVSRDLLTWTFVDTLFAADPAGWDRDHIWSPQLIEDAGRFWLFYTGVRDSLIGGLWRPVSQAIGLAWSDDLVEWHRVGPVLECGPPATPWLDCSEGGVRDPFVMRMDDSVPAAGQPPGWLLYHSAKPGGVPTGYYNDYAFVVGVARADPAGLGTWSDLGGLWSTYRAFQPDTGMTNLVESPHLVRRPDGWHLFFTGVGGVYHLRGADPLGSLDYPDASWTWLGLLPGPSAAEYASETFRATWADSSTEDFFATVESFPGYRSAIRIRQFQPAGAPLLAEALTLESIVPWESRLADGDSLRVDLVARFPSDAVTYISTITRMSPLEVFEVDSLPGGPRLDPLAPDSVGLPAVVAVTTDYRGGDTSERLRARIRFLPDDDETPGRMELLIRGRGADSPLILVHQNGVLVDAGPTSVAPPAVSLRALSGPAGRGLALAAELPRPSRAVLELFDVGGRRVRRLTDRALPAGRTVEPWDGRDDAGAALGAGVYLARLETPSGRATARVILLR